MPVLVVILGAVLSGLTYGWLEPARGQRGLFALRRAWIPFLARAIAWSALGILLLDVSCAVPGRIARPLVLLDASLSLAADSGRWKEARDSAEQWGDVRTFGDERSLLDSAPQRGRSRLAPALQSAAASDRPIIVVSDGEIEDVNDLPADLVTRAGVRLFPRHPGPDLAITSVEGPARVTAGDSVPLDIVVRTFGTSSLAEAGIQVMAGDRILASRPVQPVSNGESRVRIVLPSSALRPEINLLSIGLTGAHDAESRDDSRLFIVSVTPTPGVVLLANPGDWDSRFLYRALLDVAQLPVRGYVRLESGRWRSYTTLAPVGDDEVRRAAQKADLLILKGDQALARSTGARGLWLWPSGEGGATVLPGDWYVSPGLSSPIAGAFTGLPLDSFPPAVQITPVLADSTGWVALSAQNGRRGPERPVVLGRSAGNRREVTVAADGLWRWAFRGGSSEQGYRSWVAATASWLLGGADSLTGRARPIRPVVPNQRPIVFEWRGGGAPAPLEVVWNGAGVTRRDTLRFDGAGQAAVWLLPGSYQYRLEGGGSGLVAVEVYSDEWLPRPVTLQARPEGAVLASASPSRARGWIWLFAVCVLGLAVEWLARRRQGLR
ncbi:MAG: hypothetical protein ABI679_09740 [Gemmatimonadota bacterium]